jgi:hypothetical protein
MPKAGAVRAFNLIMIWLLATIACLAVWIGLSFWFNTSSIVAVPADAIFNALLVTVLAFAGLPLFHRAICRWFWARESASVPPGTEPPAFGSVPTMPVPRTRRTLAQTLLYAAIYAVGICLLMYAYGPLSHITVLMDFLLRFSSSGTVGSLAKFVVATGPMLLMLAVLLVALNKERIAIRQGVFDEQETLRLRMKQNWLFAFAAAFPSISFLCFLVSTMTHGFLS